MTAIIPGRGSTGNGELIVPFASAPLDLHDAVYHTVHGYPGGVGALAARMPGSRNAKGELVPMSASTLQHKANPNNVTHYVFLHEARDVQLLTDNFAILHSFAASLGHIALKTATDCEGMTLAKVTAMTKEFGDVLSAVSNAQRKGGERGERVSPRERKAIVREAIELMGALNCLVANEIAQERGG